MNRAPKKGPFLIADGNRTQTKYPTQYMIMNSARKVSLKAGANLRLFCSHATNRTKKNVKVLEEEKNENLQVNVSEQTDRKDKALLYFRAS